MNLKLFLCANGQSWISRDCGSPAVPGSATVTFIHGFKGVNRLCYE